MSVIDFILEPISQIVHVPVYLLKYFSSFVLSLPMTYYCRYLPNNPSLKHKVYGSIGILMSLIVFGPITFSIIFLGLPIYYIAKTYPTRIMATITTIVLILHLACIHLYKILHTGVVYNLSFSTVHMMYVIKFSTFVWSVVDAHENNIKLCEHRKQMMIKTYPSLLEFFGYTFFFPGIFSGPSLEYIDYIKFITLEQFKNYPKDKMEGDVPQIPMKMFYKRIGLGITFYMLVWAISIFEPLLADYYFLEAPESHGFFFKMFAIWYTGEMALTKYIGTWYVADAMSIIGGFGFTTIKNGKEIWDKFTNIDFPVFYLSTSFRNSIVLWNRYVQNWLSNYIYLNLEGTKLDAFKTVITNLVSAFWHGFLPGYYISFGTLALHTELSKLIYKKLTPYIAYLTKNNNKMMTLWNIFLIIFTNLSIKYNFCPFFMMTFKASWEMFKQTYFCFHLIALVLFIWLTVAPPKIPKEEKEKKNN
ncbi:membrane-bound O-acyltransferase family protein [Entamoeba histolytica HM-1:IMSS-B]|uniref:Membrane-bound O-acyltransferase (MBOAT ) family protein n=6 Tax=Entamoeba histolytica TaxID=5759 RepID=C4LVJ0_ENTH1|nr:membrane-bound O-acyltransferase (MBOAT) family protein [Entamoeba histolytica HM-1:IMSS]EMD48723.1 Oacyltransferase (membrane bound) domain containing protein [Entamoeba histolytica KU27]EMH76988.1 membrane-bound O-acyltransferase family protein [Entamoeba histolytica HM-1:IMSS-B]EMS13423.1 O-acyltransferase (membrane bound) domain containing protein [Entamoeba histolytica HM-3:IMSS]ENY64837.1 O-acyltransferase (membrane bound) domain containing protein [Entamoeba histolytica HM-1:IMSS-A]G|eukprot:XP_652418.2 membrane-bound O-acyltransferase (MBOAT) family protein [Entamoeba histolytica HM-1:IMSS]